MFSFLKHLFKLQFLIILLAVLAGIYYPEITEKLKSILLNTIRTIPSEEYKKNEKLFTKAELSKFTGESSENTPIYLGILGTVFDVTKGRKHYGPGCTYNYFVGRDASKSFITGEFEKFIEDESDDVNTLKPDDLLGLINWRDFYNKEYKYVGKLIGRFYDEQGVKTSYHHQLDALVKQATEAKAQLEQKRDLYPDCNIKWTESTGTQVWCTNKSGGKHRNWVGYPRKLYKIGSENFRCACIQENDLENPSLLIKPYENCKRLARSCNYKV